MRRLLLESLYTQLTIGVLVTNMVKNTCWTCGTEISPPETFRENETHCRGYCCGCCPSKNGFRGEQCQRDWIARQEGRPVGFMETMAAMTDGDE